MGKKKYQTPFAEKISFNYKDQVVASNGITTQCHWDGVMGFSILGCYDKIIVDNGMNN